MMSERLKTDLAVESLVFHAIPSRRDFIRPDFIDADGNWQRSILVNGRPAHIVLSPSGRYEVAWPSRRHASPSEVSRVLEALVTPILLPRGATSLLPKHLAESFRQMSPLVHIRSESLFEAVIKAVLRQVIRAAHATELTDRFIAQFGESLNNGEDRQFLFPTPKRLARVSVEDLALLGVGFKAKTIAAVSEAFCKRGTGLEQMRDPVSLIEALCQIRGVGPWSARVAAVDFLGAWSEYPVDDLAVQTWAKRLWPTVRWPDKPADFADLWRRKTGPYTGILTFYLLTLGLYRSASERQAVA